MKNVLYPREARLPLRGEPSLLFGLFSLLIASVLFGPSHTLFASDPCSPDRQPPQIVFCPPDIMVECGTPLTPPNTGGSAVAVDLCDPSPIVTYADEVALAVTPTDLDGWVFAVQGFPVTALAEMSAGPGNPPLGSGSFHASIGANGENLAEMRNFSFDHVPLAGVTELSYWTYRTMDGAGPNRNIYVILNIDTDGDGFGDDVIYFEPRFQHGSNPGLPDQGAMAIGTWQKWDAYLGGWWSWNHPEVMAPGTNVQSLATYLAAFPGARIVNGLSGGGVRLTAGGGAGVWNNFDGHADYFVLGTNGVSHAYNFDLSAANLCPTVTIRTWTATDQSGNAVSCSQKITLDDTTPPALVCGPTRVVACGQAWDFDAPTVTDPCGGATLMLVSAATNATCGFTLVATRTWQAVDDCGNVAQCIQTVTVADTVAPVVTCPADVTIECMESSAPRFTGTATASDDCGDKQQISYTDSVTPGACPQAQIITRTWTATDACNNTARCDQTITVADRQPPVVTCAASKTVECGTPWSFDLPTASDACGPVTITEVGTLTNAACGDTMTVSRTWLVADACGNEVPCMQAIAILDTTVPLLVCAPDKTVECGQPWIFDVPAFSDECVFEALVFDNSVNDAIYRFSSDTTEVGDEIILEGTARQITRFAFEYFGVNKNTKAPEFEGSVTARVRFYANDGPGFYRTPQTVLYDSGDFTVPATTRSVVTIEDFQLEAAIPLVGNVPDAFTWTVQFSGLGTNDAAGLDIYTPIVVGLSYRDYWERTPQGWQIKTNADVDVNFAARIDAVRESVRARVVNTETNTTGACGQAFVATRTWEAVDPCGNLAQCSQAVTVSDTTKPVVVCPPNVTVECGQATDPSATGAATATDNCDRLPVVTFSDAIASGTCPQNQGITRTWIATDACGHSQSCDQVIRVIDGLAPTVNCPADVTVACDASTDLTATGTATATDNCDPTPLVSYTDVRGSGPCAGAAVVTRTWTARDACGNGRSCSQLITLLDTLPPVINCPAEVTIECDQPTAPSVTGLATAADNCDANPSVTFSDATVAGACPQGRVITRTWTATDSCGNGSGCQQTITVLDRTPPVVSCPANVVLDCGAATDPSATGTASATDACAASVPVTFSDVVTPGTCPQAQVIARTWTATDPCGNEGRCVQTIALRDSSPPVIVCPGTITTSIGTESCQKVVEFVATATDACSDVSVECIPPSGHPFPNGTTTVTCTATDTCGNQSACSFSVVVLSLAFSQTVNRAIPDNYLGGLTNTLTVTTEITSIADVDVTLSLNHTWNGDLYAYLVHDTGRAVLLNRVGRRTTGTPNLLGYGDDGFDVTLDDEAANGDVHVYRMKLFGNHNTPVVGRLTGIWAPDGRATPPSQATESDPRTALLSAFRGLNPNGQWTLVVADVQGGDAGLLQSWSIRLCGDVGVAPTITAPPESVTVECTTDATFSVTAIGSPPLSYQWHFGPNPIGGATGTTLTVRDVQSDDLGDYSVVVMNGFGQVSSGVATLSLADTRLPQIACPPAIVVPNAPGQCTAVVASYGVFASDTCGSVTIVCTPPEGHSFDKGQTPVHCTATDAANNVADCSFTVTVEDRELPTLTCPADIAVDVLTGQCSKVVTYATPSSADNCTGVTVSCVPRSGESFRGGPTPVVCTATDTAGNRSECTFTVTVRDSERPEVCMDPPTTFSAGDMDNFVGPQPTSPSTTLQAYAVTHALALQDFDAPAATQWLAHSFGGFPENISSARLLIRARTLSTASLDDSLQLVFSQAGGLLRNEQWTRRFGLHEAVPGLLPVAWSAGTESEFELDLARLPNADGTYTNLLPVLRQVGALDLLVQNDTEVDYVTLAIETCQCSTSIVVDSDPGHCSARVMFPLPAFFDNCDPNPTVVCLPPPGATFALGVTRVDCTATDSSGNVGHCSFDVTVNAAGLELSYARSGANLVLSWPVGCGNYELLETSSLDSPIVWTPSPVSVDTVGSMKTATVPISDPQKYFHLRKTLP